MVPKVAGKGSSFNGAALYYLHDKGALTSGRVAFVHTENLPTRDAEKAIKCMAWTAMHQREIKARAGGSAKGRKLELPVYTYSLSWAPGETPTPEEMIAAAQETMKALSLDGHEALFVSHNDEPHPHIHVIVNRVHPETGIAAPLSNDHLKLSTWAEAYEKRQGQIRCEQRVENNARRRKKEWIKDQFSQHAAEYYRWRRDRTEESFRQRQEQEKALSAEHRQQRQTLYIAKEERIAQARAAIKDRHKHQWRAMYVKQQQDRDELHHAQRTAWSRLRYFLREKAREYFHAEREHRTGFLKGAFAAISGGPRQFADLDKKQRASRAKNSAFIRNKEREAFKKINEEFAYALDMLKRIQKKQQEEQQKRHTEESQRRAREIKEGKDWEEFRKDQARRQVERIKETGKDITKPRSETGKAFDKASGRPPPEPLREETLQERLRRKASQRLRRDFREQAADVPEVTKEFGKASGGGSAGGKAASTEHESERERIKRRMEERRRQFREQAEELDKDAQALKGKQAERRAKKITAFRDLVKEITQDKGRERTTQRPPPKGPKNGR